MAKIFKHCKNCGKEFITDTGQINAGYGNECHKQEHKEGRVA